MMASGNYFMKSAQQYAQNRRSGSQMRAVTGLNTMFITPEREQSHPYQHMAMPTRTKY